jgi:hypothetical protein
MSEDGVEDVPLSSMPFSFLLRRILSSEQQLNLHENVRKYRLKAKLKALARTVRLFPSRLCTLTLSRSYQHLLCVPYETLCVCVLRRER